jgi:molybdopterin-containing oxidoreductase family iron-sulfur binding subunit
MNTRKDLGSELAAAERRLGTLSGKRYWRGLEELAETAAFQEMMKAEFPEQADIWPDTLNRRQFLTLMAASLALANLPGCSVQPSPAGHIRPDVQPPRDIVPGRPLFFATTMAFAGQSVGLLVESHMGRPTKIEGNPQHPASLGATNLFNQASVLTLYDPDRSQVVTHLGRTRTWGEAAAVLRDAGAKFRQRKGAGLRILSEPVISPTLDRQRAQLLKSLPEVVWHVWDPIHQDTAGQGAQMAFGRAVNARYDFTKADVVVSFDENFLSASPGNLRYVADFMSRRRIRTTPEENGQVRMNRLYVVETAVTTTGAKADHRLALPCGEIAEFAQAVAAKLGVPTEGSPRESNDRWATALAQDLEAHRGRCLILAGQRQPPLVHLLAHVLNQQLGNVGETVFYTPPIEAHAANRTESLRQLVSDMEQGRVEFLLILGSNPVYSAPADLPFTEHLQKVPFSMHLGLYQDETARYCHWHIPEAHYLEAWGDARAFDGTASIVQPLIEPLYHGRSALEVVSLLATLQEVPGEMLVRDYWRASRAEKQATESFEEFWATSLHDGVIAGTAFPPLQVQLHADWQRHLKQGGGRGARAEVEAEPLELAFQADPTIYDGTFANNGWLQELPKPITKLTWDNAALMSPTTAEQLGVGLERYAHGGEHGGYDVSVVELKLGERTLRAPAWIMPGHAERSITITFGYGRDSAGKIGGNSQETVGFDAFRLRTTAHPWYALELRVAKLDETFLLACTQVHHSMEDRELARSATLEEYRQEPGFAKEPERKIEHEPSMRASSPLMLYDPFRYEPPLHKWGMVIDLTTCIGCETCVIACQAENNIPIVGKTQVAAGREMHWLRIDRYMTGPLENPDEVLFQPIPCMHCEYAPCEYVCPTAATVHSAEGLNEMIYNRCVGTRFCSNNCPYKVRRFNFLQYSDYSSSSRSLQYNPDVTVRSRGVMEKCTYCVQRIRHAEIDAEKEERPIADGEILTACQAACPATAIMFGDLNDPQSIVSQWKESPLEYALLADLNTRPRTTYLAALRNPNPQLQDE